MFGLKQKYIDALGTCFAQYPGIEQVVLGMSDTQKVSLDLAQKPSGVYWLVFLDESGKRIGSSKMLVSH